MEPEQQISDFEEILNILDPDIRHFPDKLARWIFKNPELLRRLVFMLRTYAFPQDCLVLGFMFDIIHKRLFCYGLVFLFV